MQNPKPLGHTELLHTETSVQSRKLAAAPMFSSRRPSGLKDGGRDRHFAVRFLDALLFAATFTMSIIFLACAFLLIPVVVLISSIAGLFEKHDALTQWTEEAPRQLAVRN